MTCQHDPLTRFGRSDGANDEVPLPALSASEAPLNAMAADRDFTFADAPNSFGYRCGSDRQPLAAAPVKKDEMLQPFIAKGLYPRLTSGLPRATQLPPIPVLPPVKDQKAVPTRVSIKFKERMAAPSVHQRHGQDWQLAALVEYAGFPEPIVVNGRRYWWRSEIVAWERRQTAAEVA
jgi:hypothetical protein